MGVPGLWDILRPAAKQRALTHLAVVDGFERNPSGVRGLRVGIDASIWFYHATYGREGENPELRTLFFRCARLMSKPFLPLFVFDGPKRPKIKRKKKVSGKSHWLISGMQELIEAFGFEWRMAPGEAEAELAYLNKAGIIDAIITDDVDTLVFGATMLIRNPGKMLSGNAAHPVRGASGKDDGEHAYVYSSADIRLHEDVGLTQGGLVLIALLCGGDYDSVGLQNCGMNVAYALARCGLGDKLLDAAKSVPRERLPEFLSEWRESLRTELRTNSSGYLPSKKAALSKSLSESFPDIDVLLLYTHPITSERAGRAPSASDYLWAREPDLGKLAALCERKFEWGVRQTIIKRFRTVIWAPTVLRILRRAVLDADADANHPSTPRRRSRPSIDVTGTPSRMITKHFSSLSFEDSEGEEDNNHHLIVKIHSKREHSSTDGVPEYRLEVAPTQLVRLTEAGIQGVRQPVPKPAGMSDSEDDEETCTDDEEDSGCKKKKGGKVKRPIEPNSHLRIWMPASLVSHVEPALIRAFEDEQERKNHQKEHKAQRKAERAKAKNESASISKATQTSRRRPKMTVIETAEAEEEELSAEDFSHAFGLAKRISDKSKSKTRAVCRATRTHSKDGVITLKEQEEQEGKTNPRDAPQPFCLGPGTKDVEAKLLKSNSNHEIENQHNPKIQRSSSAQTKPGLLRVPGCSALLDVLNATQPIASLSQPPEISASTHSATSADEPPESSLAPFPLHMSDNDMDSDSRTSSRAASQSSRTLSVLSSQSFASDSTDIFHVYSPGSNKLSSKDRLCTGRRRKLKSSYAPKRSSILEISSESEQGTPKAVTEARRRIKPLVAARERGRLDTKERVISSGPDINDAESDLSLSDGNDSGASPSTSATRASLRTDRSSHAGPSALKTSSRPTETAHPDPSRTGKDSDFLANSRLLRPTEGIRARMLDDSPRIIDLSSDSDLEINASGPVVTNQASLAPKASNLASGRSAATAARVDSFFPSVKPLARNLKLPSSEGRLLADNEPTQSAVTLPEVIDLT